MPKKSIYDEGMSISRKFETRADCETQRLYDIIKNVILVYQQGTSKEREKALDFLTRLFEPLIRKVSSRIYNNLKSHQDYEDVMQETYTMFLSLLDRYNIKKSSFSYFIGVMLPQHMNRWAEKELLHTVFNISVDTEEYVVVDPTFSSVESVESYLNGFVLTHEYQDFIMRRADRQSRSTTVSEVCHRYFLGSDSCSEIAKDLGISYHAVYEIIGKIKKELEQFFQFNVFSEYMHSSTGITKKRI